MVDKRASSTPGHGRAVKSEGGVLGGHRGTDLYLKRDILLAEYDPTAAGLYASALLKDGFNVVPVNSRNSILAAAGEAERLAVVVLDFDLVHPDGVQMLLRLRAECAGAPVIVTTSKGSLTSAVDVMRAGAFDYLIKPVSPQRLVAAVHAAANICLPAKSAAHACSETRMLGSSAAISRVSHIIEMAAASRAAVFISGESGTGKEICAELIHQGGERVGKPFVAVNCSALPGELIESEIFGHVKGAFTGATSDRPGAAILAHRGTLFLDEICEMDLSLQAKLLRFLQNGRVRRLGAGAEEAVDVRIICATNRNPRHEMRAGRFREDLYYRLHVIPINLPPLRERGDDVIELARIFVSEYAAEENRGRIRLSPCAEAAIAGYAWPGNIRQLQNMIRNAVVFSQGDQLTRTAFPELVSLYPQSSTVPPGRAEHLGPREQHARTQPPSAIKSLAEIERDAIEQSMRINNNNIARAAATLNISPSTIYRKLQNWNKAAVNAAERQ